MLQTHIDSKHSKLTLKDCFPDFETPEGKEAAAAAAAAAERERIEQLAVIKAEAEARRLAEKAARDAKAAAEAE